MDPTDEASVRSRRARAWEASKVGQVPTFFIAIRPAALDWHRRTPNAAANRFRAMMTHERI
jgi:hypothetical protein